MNDDFLRDGAGAIASFTGGTRRRAATAPAPAPSPVPVAAPQPAVAPVQDPATPAAGAAPEITPDGLKGVAKFAGDLVKAAEGMDQTFDSDLAIARVLQDGSIAVKIPLGPTPRVSLDMLQEIGKDLTSNLFGYLKTVGMGRYGSVENLCVVAGAACAHDNLTASAFVVAFSLQAS